MVSAGNDCIARITQVDTGFPVMQLIGHKCAIRSVAFNSDARYVVTVSADGTCIWDVNTGTVTQTFSTQKSISRFAALSPDDAKLAIGDSEDDVTVYDIRNVHKEVLYKIGHHDSSVRAAAFSPDNQNIVTGGDGPRLSIWDAKLGSHKHSSTPKERSLQELLTLMLTVHEDSVIPEYAARICALSVSDDSKCIATARADKTTRIVDMAQDCLHKC